MDNFYTLLADLTKDYGDFGVFIISIILFCISFAVMLFIFEVLARIIGAFVVLAMHFVDWLEKILWIIKTKK
jgi:hypothetical protein